MATYCVVGTDTDVGKTVFTGLFANYLQDQNRKVITQKWVQTGCDSAQTALDIQAHNRLMGVETEPNDNIQRAQCPYRFMLPASAHLAAKKEGKQVDINRITMSLQVLEQAYDDVIVEGLGGVLSPLTATMTFLDLLEQLKLETIIVVKNKVGAINHALLTIEALASRHIPMKGFVCNTVDSTLDLDVKKDNPLIIQQLSGVSLIASLGPEKQVKWLF